jgi:hypothetical protein
MGLKCGIISIMVAETTRSKFKRRATSKLKSHFESNKEKAMRECRKLQDEEIGNLYFLRNIIRLMKS